MRNVVFRARIKMRPVPKGRPRFTKSGHPYTPAKTRKAESDLRTLVEVEHRAAPIGAGVPLSLWVAFHYATKDKKKLDQYKITKPDLDNLVKLVKDALNGLAYHDDSQIVRVEAVKRWSAADLVEIKIGRLDV